MAQSRKKKKDQPLEEHSKRKHALLRSYLNDYIITRLPVGRVQKFNICIVDAFAGPPYYPCGSPGSSVIFLDELSNAIDEINIQRHNQGFHPAIIHCTLVTNDSDSEIYHNLNHFLAIKKQELSDKQPFIYISIWNYNLPFKDFYPEVREVLKKRKFTNVFFNLDQFGWSEVSPDVVADILTSWTKAEVFYTLAIESLHKFIPKRDDSTIRMRLEKVGLPPDRLLEARHKYNTKEWHGYLEQLIFELYRGSGNYVSPFGVNNPGGYTYWLLHFANNYRARQVYNKNLHANANAQFHIGRSGIDMLGVNPAKDYCDEYLFSDEDRKRSRDELYDDIARVVDQNNGSMTVGEFYKQIYNQTPAHPDDIDHLLVNHGEVKVITPRDRRRKTPENIRVQDVISQLARRSLFT